MFSDQEIMAATIVGKTDKGLVLSYTLPNGHEVKSAAMKEIPRGEPVIQWCDAVRNRQKAQEQQLLVEQQRLKDKRKKVERYTPEPSGVNEVPEHDTDATLRKPADDPLVRADEQDPLEYANYQRERYGKLLFQAQERLEGYQLLVEKYNAGHNRWVRIVESLEEESDELSSESTEDDS